MAIDEHTSGCSNSNSGSGGVGGVGCSNRLSKKSKSKKVPQRGMGVAQLEKIISEEQQQKKDNSVISPSNSGSVQKVVSFRQPIVCCSSSSIPLPPPLPPNHHSLVTKNNKPMNMSGGSSWGRLWSDGDYNFESEKQNRNQEMDHSRYTAPFSGNLGSLPYESNQSIWPPAPNLMLQRSQHFQQPCYSSMVNVLAGTTSSSSSSVMNFPIEPPSNQSYCGNNYQPLWPEEEKMVGMKRPYPFSLENVPIPSFHCKFPSAYSPFSRSDESASCSNGGGTTIEPALPAFRENPSSLGVPDTITKKFIDENQVLTRDFLKLAPPQASQSNTSLCIGEQPQFDILPPLKGQSKDSTHLSGRVGSNPQSFLTFFPAAKAPMGHPGNNNGEAGESVDLNLKL